MKLQHFTLLLFNALLAISIQAQTPDFSMSGFATMNGNTTGGENGQVVTPTSFIELKNYVEDETTPYIIRIDKEFTTGVQTWVTSEGGIVSSEDSGAIETTFGAILKVGSNKTLIGIGDQAFFNRIGLVIQCQSNIIIRNIKFTMLNVPATRDGEYKILDTDGVTTIGDPDCIGIQADKESIPEANRISQHIWIDHCEFYNEVTSSKDRYDGLLDNKNNVQNLTISWNYFHDHSKSMLSGKGSSDNYNRTITFHHNYFKNIYGSRLPLLRYGQHHYFNNYMEDCGGDGLNLRIETNAYIENNYFKNSKKPVFGKISENGQGLLIENIFENCSRLPAGITNINGGSSSPLSSSEDFVRACNFTPSSIYNYANVLTPTAEVPLVVSNYSGVGVITDYLQLSVDKHSTTENNVWTYDKTLFITTKVQTSAIIYDLNGKLIQTIELLENGSNKIPLNLSGVYILKLQNKKGENYSNHKLFF